MALLETHGLTVRFGGVTALQGVDLRVDRGELVGLIGPNGAGKTTCIDAITGFVHATGRVVLEGREVGDLPAHERARLGIGRTWQSLELFDDLTIRENLQVASDHSSLMGFLADLVVPRRHRNTEAVDWALDVLGIAALADALPVEVSQGQRKLVSAARALAARPVIVCMDEPAAGLDSDESRALGGRLRDIIDAGITILLVDHDMGLVVEVCDRLHVIEFGVTIAEGAPAEVMADPRVVEAYLGTSRSGSTGAD